MTDITIRPAVLDDARAIARFHVAVWRHTYATLAPEEAVRVLDEARRLATWTDKLSVPVTDQIVLLAHVEGELAGIGAASAASEPAFGDHGEIKFLYIDPKFKRRGLGRRLLSDLATHLADRGYRGAALGVVDGNAPAIAFYEALGGRPIGRYTDTGPIWRSENIVFAWDDISRLFQPAPSAVL